MRAYGSLTPDAVNTRSENYAPSSKEADLDSRHRHTTRRALARLHRRAGAHAGHSDPYLRAVADTTL